MFFSDLITQKSISSIQIFYNYKFYSTNQIGVYCEDGARENIFNMASNQLHEACNPMLTKCIFQIIGDIMKQLTLSQDEIEQTVHYIGCEDLFMRNRHKLNINESVCEDASIYEGGEEILIKREEGLFPTATKNKTCSNHSHYEEIVSNSSSKVTEQKPKDAWKELSIDTFNLTPKSPRSKVTSPQYYDQSQRRGTPNRKQIKEYKQPDLFLLEELESQVFTLKSENMALKKSIDALEDSLAKYREEHEHEVQCMKEDHDEASRESAFQLNERDQQIHQLHEDLNDAHSQLDYLHDLQTSYQELKGKNAQLEQVCQKQESDIDLLTSQHLMLNSEINKKTSEVKKLTIMLKQEEDQSIKQIQSLKMELQSAKQAKPKAVPPQPVLKVIHTSTKATQANEDLLGIETFADKYKVAKEECRSLKEQNEKTLTKLAFYKDKSMRLDDTVMVTDGRIDKLASKNLSLEEHIDQLQEQMRETVGKYRAKKKELQLIQSQSVVLKHHKEKVVIAVAFTFLLSLFISKFFI